MTELPRPMATESAVAAAPSWKPARHLWALGAALVAAVVLVFGQSVAFELVDWDDASYISDNLQVLGGLELESLRWAFTSGHGGVWQPLSWLSHMLDIELFGTWAGGHHLTNTLLHAANAVLLLVWLVTATGRVARAASVAAIWAVHPLRVESVAWVTERKDLLCAMFFLLTLLAYGRWTSVRRTRGYLLVSACLLGALLAKPMAVTLPLVLFLLDAWPYDQGRPPRARVLEKLPWLLLAATAAIITFLVGSQAGAIAGIALPLRLANAVVSYVRYLGLTFWPTGLSALYPHPNLPGGQPWRASEVLAAASLLVALSAWAWIAGRRCPAIAVGWAWYVVMLVPVIGLVQAGEQALADRFTYLPQIGLLMAIVWGIADFGERRAWTAVPGASRRLALTVALLIAVLAALAAHQCRMWRDSESLFARSLAATPNNPVVLRNLARARRIGGDLGSAEALLRQAIALRPHFPQAHLDLAYLLADTGRFGAASDSAVLALADDPGLAAAHVLLGELVATAGQSEPARREYARALALDPELHIARLRLGSLELETNQGRVLTSSPHWADAAIEHYRRALAVRPASAAAATDLGVALRLSGRLTEAAQVLRTVLDTNPSHATAHYELALTLDALGDRPAAEWELDVALTLRPDWPAAQRLLSLWSPAQK